MFILQQTSNFTANKNDFVLLTSKSQLGDQVKTIYILFMWRTYKLENKVNGFYKSHFVTN